ncbi:zinc finger protein 891-like isoform X1 [Diabrotica virgifera virgifera]|uniref:C2H2-type domain-containing protein n=2 Tax=Diabrotica virgifera virgifera TaxID=50390 RepID=A0ABM5IDI9_DIAVI|nr:zinc finger protein 891-like isoform X1 [Diabrotica virgifera virgifera]
MPTCLVCKKNDVPLDKINDDENWNRSSTAKADLKELFGDQIKYYIAYDSSICHKCTNVLKNTAKVKAYIWKLMTHETSNYNTTNMHSYLSKFDDDDYSDEDLEMTERTATPKLLARAETEPYNEAEEEKFAERERMKSLSRSNSYYGIEDHRTPKKRKKRGTAFRLTYRKGSSVRSSSSRSRTSSRSRSRSVSSRKSVSSTSTGVTTKNSGRYSSRSHSTKSTRTINTRLYLREQAEEGRLNIYSYHCTVDKCDVGYNDMDFMDQHNVYEHKMRRLFNCEECGLSYTTAPLLKEHKMKHYTTYFFCPYCGEKQFGADDLRQHMDKHSEYSVDCKYCDKSFLSSTLRNEHSRIKHKGETQKKKKSERLILARLDKPKYTEKRPVVDTSYKVRYLGTKDYDVLYMNNEQDNGNNYSVEVDEPESIEESADQDGETAIQDGASSSSVLSRLSTDQEGNNTMEEVADPDSNNVTEEAAPTEDAAPTEEVVDGIARNGEYYWSDEIVRNWMDLKQSLVHGT